MPQSVVTVNLEALRRREAIVDTEESSHVVSPVEMAGLHSVREAFDIHDCLIEFDFVEKMSYETGKLFWAEVLKVKLPAAHPYTFVRLFSRLSADIRGYVLPSGAPMSGDPPYP